MAKMAFRLPQAARVIENPSAEEAKALAAEMPNARPTSYGNLNVQTEVLARSKRSTFVVTDEPDGQNQAVSRDEAERWADTVEDAKGFHTAMYKLKKRWMKLEYGIEIRET